MEEENKTESQLKTPSTKEIIEKNRNLSNKFTEYKEIPNHYRYDPYMIPPNFNVANNYRVNYILIKTI